MVQEELSAEDKKRVGSCDYYHFVKNVMKSHEDYKKVNVGDVFFIRCKKYGKDTEYSYVSRSYNGTRDKYMVFHKDDEGFVFIKRVNADGKLGKEVQCLTTQYPGPKYEIEPDPDYVEAIIFEEEASYDPLKSEKDLTAKKGKARRKNKKLEVKFEEAKDAFDFIKALQVGGKIYDCNTSYGDGIIEWNIKSIISRATDKTIQKNHWGKDFIGNTREDQNHNNNGLFDFIQLEIEAVGEKPKSRRYTSTTRTVTFYDFFKNGSGYLYYKSRPYSTDDV